MTCLAGVGLVELSGKAHPPEAGAARVGGADSDGALGDGFPVDASSEAALDARDLEQRTTFTCNFVDHRSTSRPRPWLMLEKMTLPERASETRRREVETRRRR